MPEPPRFLDRVRVAVRTRHYSRRTEEAYLGWTKRFILFHRKRHPAAMGADEVNAFLSHLAVEGKVSASTQAQALSALVFLYRHVLDDPLPWIDDIVRARRSRKLPVVLAREEVRSLLAAMKGTPRLVAAILYGAGLRLLEALRLRIKDVDFAARLLIIREGKGAKDRRTMLPDSLRQPLHAQIDCVRRIHSKDVAAGRGEVWLPGALGVGGCAARWTSCREIGHDGEGRSFRRAQYAASLAAHHSNRSAAPPMQLMRARMVAPPPSIVPTSDRLRQR